MEFKYKKYQNIVLAFFLFVLSFYNSNSFASNKEFWQQKYTPSNIEILEQRIENWENFRSRHEKLEDLSSEQDGYFYNVHVVDYDGELKMRFNVWVTKSNITKERIVSDIQEIADLILKDVNWKKHMKIVIEYNPYKVLDDNVVIYDDYIK